MPTTFVRFTYASNLVKVVKHARKMFPDSEVVKMGKSFMIDGVGVNRTEVVVKEDGPFGFAIMSQKAFSAKYVLSGIDRDGITGTCVLADEGGNPELMEHSRPPENYTFECIRYDQNWNAVTAWLRARQGVLRYGIDDNGAYVFVKDPLTGSYMYDQQPLRLSVHRGDWLVDEEGRVRVVTSDSFSSLFAKASEFTCRLKRPEEN